MDDPKNLVLHIIRCVQAPLCTNMAEFSRQFPEIGQEEKISLNSPAPELQLQLTVGSKYCNPKEIATDQ